MAFWGMDLMQSDEFCEVYDEYIDLYDAGSDPSIITPFLLEKYRSRFNGEQNLPHNVYFALAKAEWTLGTQSEAILLRVNEIIDHDENIMYYRSLGFSEAELAERKDKLLQFQKALKTKRKTLRKRKVSAYNKIKRLSKGTVSWYKAEEAYYGFVVLDAVYEGRLLAVTEKLSSPPKNNEEVLNSPVLTVIWLFLRNVPKGNNDVGTIEIKGNYNGRAGVFLCKPISFGINFSFNLDECHCRVLLDFPERKVRDLLNEENVPIKFFCEETAENETKMVLELMHNPASNFAKEMIRKSVYLETFFH